MTDPTEPKELTAAERQEVKRRLIAGDDPQAILNEEMTSLIAGAVATDDEVNGAWEVISEIEEEIDAENGLGANCDPPQQRGRDGIWRGPSWAPLFALLALLTSCTAPRHTQHTQLDELHVDVSEGEMRGKYNGRTVIRVPVETARRGVGNIRGSEKTPLGTFEVYQKQKHHRFSKLVEGEKLGVMRIRDPERCGKTRHEPGARGVHIHRNLDGLPHGTKGCLCPHYDADYYKIWRMTPVGAKVKIQL